MRLAECLYMLLHSATLISKVVLEVCILFAFLKFLLPLFLHFRFSYQFYFYLQVLKYFIHFLCLCFYRFFKGLSSHFSFMELHHIYKGYFKVVVLYFSYDAILSANCGYGV